MFENTFFCTSFHDLNLLHKAVRLMKSSIEINRSLDTILDKTNIAALSKMENEIRATMQGIEESWAEKSRGVELQGDSDE